MYRPRTLEPVLRRAAREFPAILLTGPRQSGKTTLLREVFGKRTHRYVSLEAPDVRASAAADPRGFLRAHQSPVIFDEIQHAPDLLPYIKEAIDADRKPGRFVLTGSQNLALSRHVAESLAGRTAALRLLPMSLRELAGAPEAPLPWERGGPAERPQAPYRRLWRTFLRGAYPEPALDPRRDAALWHASYVQTYLERDVRGLRAVGDLGQFTVFLRALAARNAQLLNLAGLASDIGVALNTVKAWLSVLEATWQVFLLRPWHENAGKRLVKTPKVYFGDLGTACWLAGLRDPEHAAAGPMGGALFENAVVLETIKGLVHRGLDPAVWFWRTSDGREVDIVVEESRRLVPVEVKLNETPRPDAARGIEAFAADFGVRVARGFVVHPGTSESPLGPRCSALPISKY